MKIFLVALAMCLATGFAANAGGDGDGPVIVGNGGGTSEYSVVFVHQNLKQMLDDCANFSCSFSLDEYQIFSQVIYGAISKYELNFGNTENMGNRLFGFMGKGVWINQDLLWLDADKTIP